MDLATECAAMSYPAAREFLVKQGLEFLGSGCFATVYALDDAKVIKVARPSGYRNFVKLVRKAPCEAFPVIYQHVEGSECDATVLERLSARDWTDPYNRSLRMFDSHYHGTDKDDMVIPKSWVTAYEFLQEAAKVDHVSFDLHGDNLMFRADGTPVITDPFSYG